MFARRISNSAHFAPDKMGKSTVMRGDFLFVGLNAFEPGQEHAPHVHEGQDKLYFILEGTGVVHIGEQAQTLYLPVMRRTHPQAYRTRFAIPVPSVS